MPRPVCPATAAAKKNDLESAALAALGIVSLVRAAQARGIELPTALVVPIVLICTLSAGTLWDRKALRQRLLRPLHELRRLLRVAIQEFAEQMLPFLPVGCVEDRSDIRAFAIDIETCPVCGGKLRVIACIEDPEVIAKILEHGRQKDGTELPQQPRAPPTRSEHLHATNQDRLF